MSIGLNMIVKDEAKVIKRCLDSLQVEKWIDYYHIVDTGSSDDTKNIIREYFFERKIAGEVVDYPFTDFADCRNKALQGIKDKVDYVFWIDADEQLSFDNDFDFDTIKTGIRFVDFAYFRCINKGFQFRNNHLFSTELDWRWRGAVHEYLDPNSERDDIDSINIDGCHLIYNEDGNSWKDKTAKAHKHIELLEKQVQLEPTRGRWLFYLGQTWRAIDTKDAKLNAIKYYEKRIELYKKGRDAEAYVSKLMSLCLRQELGRVITPTQFLICADYDDSRVEHVIHANALYWQAKRYEAAYKYSKEAYRKYMNPPLGISELLLDMSIYTFSCAHVHAINCFYVGKRNEGLAVLQKLMDNIARGASPALVSDAELHRLKNALKALK